MLKRIIAFFDRLVLKYHKCENNLEVHSIKYETIGDSKLCTGIWYKCSICDKEIK